MPTMLFVYVNGKKFSITIKMQRANYVAMSLLYGIHSDSEGMISVTCRLPELKQIHSIENGEEITMDLIFNEVN